MREEEGEVGEYGQECAGRVVRRKESVLGLGEKGGEKSPLVLGSAARRRRRVDG